ncbi:DUF3592 domain-containing protein [Pseudarthrobacter sp. C4D7]|nr:DUF3592 domain-containing protein [Pseudarthrobacter sp. C4D7]
MTGRRIDGHRRPPLSWKGRLNLAVTLLVLCLGPVLIVAGIVMTNADEDLARTGAQATGTIVRFDDVNKASKRRITVDFEAADGSPHRTFAAVDHDQHPVVGGEATVVYAQDDPGRTVVVGYESDGVWFLGAGVVLTFIFGGIGVLAAIIRGVAAVRGNLRRRATRRVV